MKNKRKSGLKWILAVWFCSISATVDAQVTESLKAIGMENIRCAQTPGMTTVSFENNVYRSTYTGVGKAIDACLGSKTKGDLQLVVLENRIPRLCINLPDTLTEAYRNGEINLTQVYQQMGITVDTDPAMKALKNAGQEEVPSAWKMDLVIYPDLFLENNTFDELYTYAINLNPAVEMALWKGGKMTVGNFTNNRYGAQLEIKYRTNNGRWELGGTAGSTGFSAITREDGWYIGRKQRINASLNASYYEPRLNLQFDLKAGRYIYGDYGVRGDCTRHFGEYAIGLYALCTDGEINGGFHFAIPLPGKKWSRKGFFRVKPADYFAWAYGMVADGEYIEKQLGKSYSTRPNENRSSNFYQPDYIRYFLIKELQKEKSK